MPILKNQKRFGTLLKAILFETPQFFYPEMTALILVVILQNFGLETFGKVG